jgi:hypothetical protein
MWKASAQVRIGFGYPDTNKMQRAGKRPVDCVALWDDCDIKQQNYRSPPHKVWKVTKIRANGPSVPFAVMARRGGH